MNGKTKTNLIARETWKLIPEIQHIFRAKSQRYITELIVSKNKK